MSKKKQKRPLTEKQERRLTAIGIEEYKARQARREAEILDSLPCDNTGHSRRKHEPATYTEADGTRLCEHCHNR